MLYCEHSAKEMIPITQNEEKNMYKRLISAFLTVIMLFSLCPLVSFAETGSEPTQREHSVEKREFTLYLKDLSVTAEKPLPLYFADGIGDLPYMEISDFVPLMCKLFQEMWRH